MSRGKDDYRVMADIAAERAAREQDDINHGLKSGSKSSVHDNTAAAAKSAQEAKFDREQRQSEQAVQDVIFMQLANQHLGDLNAKVADGERGLIERYGENFDQVFFEQIFGNEGLEFSREERLQAIQGEIINPETGKVKEQYQEHPLASFMENRFERDQFKADLEAGDMDAIRAAIPEASYEETVQGLSAGHGQEGFTDREDELASEKDVGISTDLDLFAQFAAASPPEQPEQPVVTEQQPVETNPSTFTPT